MKDFPKKDGKAVLSYEDKQVELEIIRGSENERGVDITTLRERSGLISFDPGYVNTGSCLSSITFIDGEKGILRYRGYPIEELAESSSFLETSYLLIYGELPTPSELEDFAAKIRKHSLLHEDIKEFFNGFPRDAHPMAILSSVVSSLSTFYQSEDENHEDNFDRHCLRLMAKLPTIAAFAYKKSIGQPMVYPDNSLSYCENFLKMMFSVPSEKYQADPEMVRALDMLFVLHADHEQNCSASTVRLVRSAGSNIYACIAAGICALWGPKHGGANQEVIEMLEMILADGGNVKKYVELAKDKTTKFRLMGFGHRVYKNFDPRAKIIKNACDKLLAKLKTSDPLLDIAKQLEEAALKDSYFIEKKLYPNVDFYSGIIYRAMGIPVPAFPVMFALGRLPGWLAQAREYDGEQKGKIGRPRQIYIGPVLRSYNQ
ncbi:MAG TPA: citrate synthase [Oligoflexia bacterium]|nr:citrate synthase [Oligoflexia bacterium]HMP27850.1 citrate synthase [Oligoflexia bacterium]